MTLTNKEMTWYKQHQNEIENIINDEEAYGEYFEDRYYENDLGKGELTIVELERIIFYILYSRYGVDGFYTMTCGEDNDIYTCLMPADRDGFITEYEWAQELGGVFGVPGMDVDRIAGYISKGAELEEVTSGIRSEVARCFKECYNDYVVE